MKLYLSNYTVTPATVKELSVDNEKMIIKRTFYSEKGVYNPVTGLLKVGMLYPTPNGKLPIKEINDNCMTF